MATKKKTTTKKKPTTRAKAAVTMADLQALTSQKSFVPTAAGYAAGDRGEQVTRLQHYLAKFGYLGTDIAESFGVSRTALMPEPERLGTFDQRTVEALQKFQQFNGLPVTGELDEATLALMQKPRCGFPDAHAAEFVLQGSKWSTPNLKFAYNELTPDLTQAQVKAAINQAFGLWSAVTPLTFTEVAMNASPDILIRFAPANHGDNNNFDGPSGVLAHAYYPPPGGGALAGDTHFDEAEPWSVNQSTGIDLVTVAAHEFGHALGLAHSTVNGALMYPYYGGPHRKLEADDIAGIRALYGAKVASGGWSSLGGVITSNIAVARNADGRLELFARGTDNALWHKWQTVSSSGPWSGWSSLGGVISSDPVVGQNADGRLEVFALGTNNAVRHIWQTIPSSGPWSGWSSLGGTITSHIAVERNSDGRLEIFARGTNNALWHKWQTAPNSNWSGWSSMGGVITGNPTAARNADGRLEVFARGSNGALWHIWQSAPSSGPWSGWASMGGAITSNIAAGRNADGRLEVFVRGSNGALWHIWQSAPSSGPWSGWSSLGGVITSKIAVGRNADGRLEVFVRGTNQAVWHRWQTAANNGWN